MFRTLKDRQREQLFLELCSRGDSKALVQWNTLSYWTEVAQGMKAAADKMLPGLLDSNLIPELVIACNAAIFREHAKVPSLFFDLKSRVRGAAFAYMLKFIREGKHLKSHP